MQAVVIGGFKNAAANELLESLSERYRLTFVENITAVKVLAGTNRTVYEDPLPGFPARCLLPIKTALSPEGTAQTGAGISAEYTKFRKCPACHC